MSSGPIDPNQPPEPKPKTGFVSAHDETLGDPQSKQIPNRGASIANDVNRSNNLPNANDMPADEPAHLPKVIGRYRVDRLLGSGSFGRVYLAHDDQLKRAVAIKVPRASMVSNAKRIEEFLHEARASATLDHPNIVPVFDVGSSDTYPCFVVSKFIDGSDLETRLKNAPLALAQSIEIIATVADALHYAHMQGLVHRDIKPSNLLLDKNDRPMIGDFGLVLREQDVGHGARLAGTPAFMSPEQARGEAHRVDGRADIFSLGAVLYTLIAGRRPFKGQNQEEILDQVRNLDPRPLRSIDENIPKELDRICTKAISKRAVDRYSVAKDMAADLRAFLTDEHDSVASFAAPAVHSNAHSPTPTPRLNNDSGSAANANLGLGSGSRNTAATGSATGSASATKTALRIVPKGLRSFDACDSDFFLDLLPGPQGRDGLPESVRFWKTRIEIHNPEQTFSVGLIYGPSGCGKSSMVKAGLLPRLDRLITVVYLEATSDKTETSLINSLRRRFPDLPQSLSLSQTLATIRQGKCLRGGEKVLLVLDQFEQWLHATRANDNTELVQALRQCDGEHLQCIIMVRDDFWMAATRFMRELEIPLVEGHNSAAVDLFPPRHAQRVLSAFGRAFGELPATEELSKPQRQFIEDAVKGLAQDGKVISVRLTLFAEMFKGKPWTPQTLREVGGTEGVGSAFLEETFSARSAPPLHRAHRTAAQAVLRALLPEAGSDIKGHMRSRAQLQESSGYATKPSEFSELMQMLDRDLRLITPTETQEPVESAPTANSGEGFYQLTHDYLVPSLREWLTSKQKETRKGRAELLLVDRAAVWNNRRENRQLPSLLQWSQIRIRTMRSAWTDPQRSMMRVAARHHFVRTSLTVLALVALTVGGREGYSRLQAKAMKTSVSAQQCLEILSTADKRQLDQVLPLLVEHGQSMLDLLDKQITQPIAEDTSDADRERQAKQTAVAAVALVRLDHGQAVWPLLQHSPDPRLRSYIIDRLAQFGAQPTALLEQLLQQNHVSIRRALLLALGEYKVEQLPDSQRASAIERVQNIFQTDRDAGVHASAQWLLQQWGMQSWLTTTNQQCIKNPAMQAQFAATLKLARETSGAASAGASPPQPQWIMNNQEQTLTVIFGPVQFVMGSPETERNRSPWEDQHFVKISHSFIMSSTPITVGQFKRMDPSIKVNASGNNSSQNMPVTLISWFNAARYCNWLSEQEGIPKEQWCFEIGEQVSDVKLKDDCQTLTGYRLPTEAEFEYAIRANAVTQRHYGETEELLSKYEQYQQYNDQFGGFGGKLVSLLKPNDFGIFDALGNVKILCADRFSMGNKYKEEIPSNRINFIIKKQFPTSSIRPRKAPTPEEMREMAEQFRASTRMSSRIFVDPLETQVETQVGLPTPAGDKELESGHVYRGGGDGANDIRAATRFHTADLEGGYTTSFRVVRTP